MVATRASSRRVHVQQEGDDKDKAVSSPSSSIHHDDADTEPKPISSSEDESKTTMETPSRKALSSSPLKGMSRLFAPYCSLGIVSNGRPYCLTNHGDASFCTLSIGNRFQIYSLDKLQPILVSRTCRGQISFLQSDGSLDITVASHKSQGGRSCLSLYSKTRPIDTLKLVSSKQYDVVDMLHLGRVQIAMHGEKEGKRENVAVICVVLAKHVLADQNEKVPVVGNDDDDSSIEEQDSFDDSDASSSSSSSDSDDDSSFAKTDSLGKVVMVLASRTSLSIQNTIALPNKDSTPTVALHPSTYLNKIVVGSTNGTMSLINVRTSKIIYQFSSILSGASCITALEQSPAVDTIAVGTAKGNVHLVNLRHDTVLFTLKHPSKVTCLSFRTDGSALKYGVAPLAVGRADGTISVWDLNPQQDNGDERTLLTEMKHVHVGGIAKLSFLPQEPLLISSGLSSNSLQMHVFDNPDHSARLLKQRSGHTAPPTTIKYKHDATALLHQSLMDGSDAAVCQILSASKDQTLRVFSSARSVLDREYSQGRGLEKKSRLLNISKQELLLPPILRIATCEAKTRDWGDVVTIHKDHAMAYVWSTRRGAQSGPLLKQNDWNVSAMQVPPPKYEHATSVCISACGNYCLVGTMGGMIYKYNVQSGIPRGSYPNNTKQDSMKQRRQKLAGNVSRTMKALEKSAELSNRPFNLDKAEHDAALWAKTQAAQQQKLRIARHDGYEVTGLAVDSLNKTVLSVGMDAKLILWNFTTHAPHKKSPYKLPMPATKLCHVRDNDLAAIALEDYTVVLFDCAAQSIVRRFGANRQVSHSGPISDLDLAPDGRSLFTSSLDGTVRVWDVPTNSCVDWLGFQTPPTSLTVSPTGEFIATTHADKLGISLWSDKSFYQTVHVDGSNPPAEPARMDDPTPLALENDENDMARSVAQDQETIQKAGNKQQQEDSSKKVAPGAKEDGLITLSGLPPAHWKNLFHLELVKERNKPKEAPKKPPTAPFFLQWRGGENIMGDSSSKTGNADKETKGEDDEWAAAWSDDDDMEKTSDGTKKRSATDEADKALIETDNDWIVTKPKKRKVTHSRSHLAALLEDCQSRAFLNGLRFQAVTEHMATLGPSAIDVAFSTLCHGMHDLEEGLPLLHLTAMWLLEACESRQRYEAVNAYLHRFLYLHSNVIAGIDDSVKREVTSEQQQTGEEQLEKEQERQQRLRLLDTIAQLRVAQRSASEALKAKMQHSLCLLRHFSRMV